MVDDTKDDEAGKDAAPERETREPRRDEALKPFDPTWINRTIGIIAILAALSAGASVAFLRPPTSSLAKPMGAKYFSLMTIAGAVVAGILVFLGNAKLKSRLPWRSPGQGTWARGCTYFSAAALALFAAYTLHLAPSATSWFNDALWSKPVFGKVFAIRPILFPSAFVFFGTLLVVHLVLNRERPTEFLVETQGEMRKVSWPARREWIGSTLVVIVVMAFMALFLAGADWGLVKLLKLMRIG